MASFPADLIDWLRPGAVGAGFAIVWTEIRALHRRIDELREDRKEIRAEQRADNRALNDKLDRLMEALTAARRA